MGWGTWGCQFDDTHRTLGGTVTDNLILGDFMRYGFAANGVFDSTVVGNRSRARHSGVPVSVCDFPTPSPPAPFLKDAQHAGGIFQPQLVDGQLDAILDVHP